MDKIVVSRGRHCMVVSSGRLDRLSNLNRRRTAEGRRRLAAAAAGDERKVLSSSREFARHARVCV